MWVKLMSCDEHVTHTAQDISNPPEILLYQDRVFVFARMGDDTVCGNPVRVRIYHAAPFIKIDDP